MPGNPYASMGFVGFVKFKDRNNKMFTVRASSADLKLTQAIEKPELISGKYDRTVYKLGPKEVQGGVTFPAVMETAVDLTSGTMAAVPSLWNKAVVRTTAFNGYTGRMQDYEYIAVKYTSQNAFWKFSNCIINSFEFSVTQSDLVNITLDIMGIDREVLVPIADIGNSFLEQEPKFATRNTRAVTWNDAMVRVYANDANVSNLVILDRQYIRSFTATVNNDADRFYTLNGSLYPQDVAGKVRDITGTFTIMGVHGHLNEIAENNQTNCNSPYNVLFGYQLATCGATWLVRLPGCVFEIAQMSLTNDLLESTVNWHSLPGSRFSNEYGDEDFVVDVAP